MFGQMRTGTHGSSPPDMESELNRRRGAPKEAMTTAGGMRQPFRQQVTEGIHAGSGEGWGRGGEGI